MKLRHKIASIFRKDKRIADRDVRVDSIAMFDHEEIYENCTVQILTNSVTGEVSVGWWHGGIEDMPR